MNDSLFNGTSSIRNGTGSPPTGPVSAHTLRLALTVTHLSLVCIGTVNLLVIVLILLRPRYMRSITNVYMIGLCLADFIYLTNLTLVAATQLSDKSWPFGSMICTLYHGTETTGKYASVLFVVLLAADRYCAMCRANWCARYRNYQTAIFLSVVAWIIAFLFALPLYTYASQVYVRFKESGATVIYCIANWPSSDSARWYISISSICLFAAPMVFIIYFYYHILIKLREAVKGSKRLQRSSSTRAPYQRVTNLVLWVVIFHVICWSPFWLFNLFSSIFKTRITTHFERIVVNILHLFPYVNCALNPLLYAAHAENFRLACRSLFGCALPEDANVRSEKSKYMINNNRDVVHKDSKYVTAVILPVDTEATNYTIIKNTENRSFLPPPEVQTNRSLSDSNTLQNKHAKIEAQNSIANTRGSSTFSCHARFGEQCHPLPEPSGWRKYSELEPRPEEKPVTLRTPLLEDDEPPQSPPAFSCQSSIVLMKTSFDDENDVKL
ncbi:hypothetical protein PFISCL1PPCAC_24661 [Pristionchus fissidentatus]|uniref:G-protein coupled receptors family 1 profile domain-containing protein n=1 Tax=Pristionchus fissidentatus TaxID=1538716 RepID=A0AAV5WMK4_9BILA|nr:hypothetical protein PFISCL1PPCAC_24661 [Pristionchus fissidentatus]